MSKTTAETRTRKQQDAGSEGLKRKLFTAGEIIFQQGAEAQAAYLIAEGEVEIFRTTDRGESGIASLGRGEIFGEMSLIDGKPRTASARAVGEVELIMVGPDDLDKRLNRLAESDMVLRRLIDVFVLRLRGQLDRND